jgi:hypothetical protein
MRCFLTLALLLLLLTFVGDVAGGPNEGVSQELFIRMDGGLLTIQAKEVPHRQILEELAKRLGVQLIVAGPLEERRSLELNGMPWENALKKALSPAGWAFVYERFAEGTRLAKVFVFPPEAAETSRRAVASAVARVPPRESRVPAQAASGEEAPANPDQQEGIKAALSALVDVDAQATQALALVGLAAMGEGAVNAFVQLSGGYYRWGDVGCRVGGRLEMSLAWWRGRRRQNRGNRPRDRDNGIYDPDVIRKPAKKIL